MKKNTAFPRNVNSYPYNFFEIDLLFLLQRRRKRISLAKNKPSKARKVNFWNFKPKYFLPKENFFACFYVTRHHLALRQFQLKLQLGILFAGERSYMKTVVIVICFFWDMRSCRLAYMFHLSGGCCLHTTLRTVAVFFCESLLSIYQCTRRQSQEWKFGSALIWKNQILQVSLPSSSPSSSS